METFNIIYPQGSSSATVTKSEIKLNYFIEKEGKSEPKWSEPLIEYNIFVNHPGGEQTEHTIYKTIEGNWFDSTFNPETGDFEINQELKRLIDREGK